MVARLSLPIAGRKLHAQSYQFCAPFRRAFPPVSVSASSVVLQRSGLTDISPTWTYRGTPDQPRRSHSGGDGPPESLVSGMVDTSRRQSGPRRKPNSSKSADSDGARPRSFNGTVVSPDRATFSQSSLTTLRRVRSRRGDGRRHSLEAHAQAMRFGTVRTT